jgi:hypothetical protein
LEEGSSCNLERLDLIELGKVTFVGEVNSFLQVIIPIQSTIDNGDVSTDGVGVGELVVPLVLGFPDLDDEAEEFGGCFVVFVVLIFHTISIRNLEGTFKLRVLPGLL